MENKYYTPDITDLFIGYELEYKNIMQENIFKPEVCEQDMLNIAYSIWEENDYIETFENHIRTKYLDKEDIEKEGWVFNQHGRGGLLFSSPKNPHVRIEGDKFIYEEGYSAEYTYSLLLRDSKKIEISRYIEFKNEVIYKGDCPSINELRKIMKYLGIK